MRLDSQRLSAQDKAFMVNKLQVPAIIADYLDGQCALNEDDQFTLHEMISDMQPDSALLCIALTAERLASIFASSSPSMQILAMECGRLVEDYAPFWVQNAKAAAVDEDAVLGLLMHISEDFESLTELLDLNIAFLEAKDKEAASLFHLLSIQARAQALIADEFVSVVDALDIDTGFDVDQPASDVTWHH